MLCSAGHLISEVAKKERLFGWHVCAHCQHKVHEQGNLYHKCTGDCRHYCVCDRCFQEASRKHYDLEPCFSPFPDGLGPFSVHRTVLQPGDLQASNPLRHSQADPCTAEDGGCWSLRSSFFKRSDVLLHVWSVIIANGLAVDGLPVRISPSSPVNLPEGVREAANVPTGHGVRVAWLYPVIFDWQVLLADIDSELLGGVDVSLLTVGGFVYLKEPTPGSKETEVLCANSIAFSTRGALKFSAPQPWSVEWTASLAQAGRFHKVTVHKWAAEGAKYMCWVCPEERLLQPRAQHGGFAFLFHELEEVPGVTPGVDARSPAYFEIVSAMGASSETMPSVPRLLTSAFAFRLADSPAQASPEPWEKLKSRFLALLHKGRWHLVLHLLTEWPDLGLVTDDKGQSTLHKCAMACVDAFKDSVPVQDILTVLHNAGVVLDSKDGDGRTAFDLGGTSFRAAASIVWEKIPDLFSDPEVWFDFWDKDHNGNLSPTELAPALAAAYHVGGLGRRWIETYVNTHYRELAPGSQLSKDVLLSDSGLLHKLQSSEEFISLRDKEARTAGMPAVWRAEGHKEPSVADRAALEPIEATLSAMRAEAGWVPGGLAPATCTPLEVPSPCADGSFSPAQRLTSAREMLSWSFVKTVAKSPKAWLQGFKVSFRGGDAGIDAGGLTKAWVNEIAFALWSGDDALFDEKSTGCFFKPDTVSEVMLHVFHVKTESLYRWVGRFVAYTLYQGCPCDCRLCPWVLRWLVRVAQAWATVPQQLRSLAGDWQRQSTGERIATIRGTELISHVDEESPESARTTLRVENGCVLADFRGKTLTASMEVGRIRWSNGDIWVKCRDSVAPCIAAKLPDTPDGDDQLLDDLACMDPQFANSLWRVQNEMPEDDLQWLTFSYNGVELEPGGEDREVTAESRARYVRLCCQEALMGHAHNGLQWFAEGFFDLLPLELALGAPADCFSWLLSGSAELSSEELAEFERTVIPDGLVPRHLCNNPRVRQSASWVFNTARSMDGPLRARLLEFWTGSSRLPFGGASSLSPKPRLQVMAQAKPHKPVWEVELHGKWKPYDEAIAVLIVSAAEAGHERVQFQMGKIPYAINLHGMLQINKQTGATHRIRPRMQEVDVTDPDNVVRIDSWPALRLPEGHTCGNELWIPLCNSEEELAERLRLSVGGFEAGFALS